MKKIFVMLALALTLTACGGGAGNSDRYEAAQTAAMAEAGAFSEELEEVDADTAFALYRLAGAGLSREDLKAGADQAEAARGALEDYVQSQIDANTDYRPAEIPKLESALVDRRGETLLLVVASDLDAAKGAVGLK